MVSIREYRCSRCGRGEPEGVNRDVLVVKKVMFVGMGEGSRTLRSRVTDWLCPDCVVIDDDWRRRAFEAPVAQVVG